MFYKDFQEKRKELGLTIEQISQKIKINPDILKNIEKGEFEQLPDLYVRLFIKAYAAELGFDPEEMLKKYEAHTGSQKHDVKQNIITDEDREPEPVRRKSPVTQMSDQGKIITFISIFAIIIFVVIILKQVLSENEPQSLSSVHQRLVDRDSIPDNEPPDELPVTDVSVESNQEEEDNEQPETNATLPDSTDLLKLNIDIGDTCWVKIIIDETDTSEALFRPNATREWEAREVFDLRIGRPEVVRLFLNNTELDSIDMGVAPARIVITRDGIINR